MKPETKNGFTIIEMVVAIGVFAVVITVALGAFLNIVDIQRRIESLRVINDNLNFSLETMMREIRAGSNYGSGGTSFSLDDMLGNSINYRLNNDRIEKSINSGPWIGLTAPEVEITSLIFRAQGQAVNDNLQPRVTIIIKGLAGEKTKTKIKLNLQTTISQRKIDS